MSDSLLEPLASLPGVRVLCVGDIMLDQFVYGEVERISPESPVPILRVIQERTGLGGAGNVAHNLATLGATVSLVTVVGDDTAGEQVSEQLAVLPGCDVALCTAGERETTVKTRCIGANQQMLRIDHDPSGPLTDVVAGELVAKALDYFSSAEVLLLSDYGKGALGRRVLQRLIEAANAQNKPIVVDPKGPDFALYAGATIVTPNLKELKEATRCPTSTDQEVEAAAQTLMDQTGVQAVLTTRSEKGMTLVDASGRCHHIPTVARQIYDVSGAGDTVAAVLAAALGGGVDMVSAVKLANVAAGIVVSKAGTAAVSYLELTNEIRSREHLSFRGKLFDEFQLDEQVMAWRRNGDRIGFTNGCFDLLHPGHVKLLDEARGKCDRLVVGINDDASVRRLKGESRPIQDQLARVAILASLSHVDALVLFADDTPHRLISSIKPDLLVKGADYRLEQVVGAEFVQSYGGVVYLVGLEAGHSTTRLIENATPGK